MATKGKPVRIGSDDGSAVELLAQLCRQRRAEVIHEPLTEYLVNHRDELSRIYAETQQALATRDLDRLVRASISGRDADVAAIMATLPS